MYNKNAGANDMHPVFLLCESTDFFIRQVRKHGFGICFTGLYFYHIKILCRDSLYQDSLQYLYRL